MVEWENQQEYDEIEIERDEIHAELTKGFTKKQFNMLAELIDVEIELESYCNQ